MFWVAKAGAWAEQGKSGGVSGAPGCVFDEHGEGGEMGKPKVRPAEPRQWISKQEGLQHVCLGGVSTGRREGLGAGEKGESKGGRGWDGVSASRRGAEQ